jgi:hypothetical protein
MTPSPTSTPRTTVLCLRSLFVSLDIFPIANARESFSRAFAGPLNHSRPKWLRQRANAAANLIVMRKTGEACTRWRRSGPGHRRPRRANFVGTQVTEGRQKIRNAHWRMFQIDAATIQFARPFGQVTLMEPSKHRIEAVPWIEWYCGGSEYGSRWQEAAPQVGLTWQLQCPIVSSRSRTNWGVFRIDGPRALWFFSSAAS